MSGPGMDREKWARLSFCEQLGNIGSEVGRAINAKRAGDEKRMEGAVNRALDLFLATVEVLIKEKTHVYRAREVFIARDQFMSLLYDGNFNEEEARKIENYFMNFAYIARNEILEKRRAEHLAVEQNTE